MATYNNSKGTQSVGNQVNATCSTSSCCKPDDYSYEIGFVVAMLVIIVVGTFAGLSGHAPLVNIG